MAEIALLTTALLFGGMTLYSCAFAPFLFSVLPMETVRPVLRQAFPHFYLFVMATSGLAALLAFFIDPITGAALAAIFATTVYARQILMPAINRAADAEDQRRFKSLHGASVVITLAHILISGWILVRLFNG
ncbi:MAG: DUF4149 domain-containing protein [Pseudomonadota bacterium]